MQGSVAIISPNSVTMEKAVFPSKFGLSLTSRSVLQKSTASNTCDTTTTTARCLFGPPDPKQAKNLVREVELKNALNFGKRFNFDIIIGEPFPSAKKMKLSPTTGEESDEENDRDMNSMNEEYDNSGYIWTHSYNQDYMAKCNKHAVINTSTRRPNCQAAVSLLFAPIIHSNHAFRSSKSSKSAAPTTSSSQQSPNSPNSLSTELSESSPGSSSSTVSAPSSPLDAVVVVETNNNNISEKRTQSFGVVVEKRHNRNNSHSHSHHHHQPSAKTSSLLAAHHILTKYTNRVVKQTVMKKPRKSIITDYLQIRRRKANSQHAGKKQ